MSGSHLGRQHRFNLILRLNVFDDGKHEIEIALVKPAICRNDICELPDKSAVKVEVRCPECFREECLTDHLVWMIQ